MKVKIKKLSPEAVLPSYALEGDAGLDIYALEDSEVSPGARAMIPTGVAIEIPKGYVALVWDKGGIAYKNGIKTMAGVCDSNYRGEYKIIILNTSKEIFKVKKGNKIAQILIQKVEQAEIEEVKDLSDTERGSGGFGSTGLTSKSNYDIGALSQNKFKEDIKKFL